MGAQSNTRRSCTLVLQRRALASGIEKSVNLSERNMSSSMPPSLLGSILDSNRVGKDGGENESRSEDDNIDNNYDNEQEEERGNRPMRLASEDYKSQDEDLDTTDKDLDEKASPRRESSSLVKWWRSRDSLLSPKAR